LCKSLCIPIPSQKATQLRTREANTGSELEEGSHTASEAELCWYNLDWPRYSALSAYTADLNLTDYAYLAESEELTIAAISEAQDDPKSLLEARSRPDWLKWQEAMDREIGTLKKAGT
jgi:hypothetical protein